MSIPASGRLFARASALPLVKTLYNRHLPHDLAAVDSVRYDQPAETKPEARISAIPELRNIPRPGKSFFNNCSPPRTAKCYRGGDRGKNAWSDVRLWNS